jgi:hypothetical protein
MLGTPSRRVCLVLAGILASGPTALLLGCGEPSGLQFELKDRAVGSSMSVLDYWRGTWEGVHQGVWFENEVTHPLSLTVDDCGRKGGVEVVVDVSWGFPVAGYSESGGVRIEGCSSDSAQPANVSLTKKTIKAVIDRGDLRWTVLGTLYDGELFGDVWLQEIQPDGSLVRKGGSDFGASRIRTG